MHLALYPSRVRSSDLSGHRLVHLLLGTHLRRLRRTLELRQAPHTAYPNERTSAIGPGRRAVCSTTGSPEESSIGFTTVIELSSIVSGASISTLRCSVPVKCTVCAGRYRRGQRDRRRIFDLNSDRECVLWRSGKRSGSCEEKDGNSHSRSSHGSS